MSSAEHRGPLWIGPSGPDADELASALDCVCRIVTPDPSTEDSGPQAWARNLTQWRSDHFHAARHAEVVVALLSATEPVPVLATSLPQWRRILEVPFAVGFCSLQLAATSCADGGSIVVVVDLPASLDAAGHAATVAVGEGICTAARCLALTEGARRVRVNTVTTSVRTERTRTGARAGSDSPLARFPGSLDREVAGAVHALFGADTAGVTGQVLHADCGRSW